MAEGVPSIFLKALTSVKQGQSDKLGKFFFFGGVILPVLAVLFETTTHFCASHFFDPFPSASHVVLFLLIPLTNFLAWLTQHKDLSQHYSFMALATGMAAGIGIMYSLMFLPILGLSLVFAVVGGFGLLGLAPTLSLPCTFRSEKRVCKLALAKGTYCNPHQLNHVGHLIILVMIIAIELPSTMTRLNLNLADNPKTAAAGVKWLRKYGSQEVMLRACYERSGRATDILGSLYESARPLHINDARNIFYKVTGKPFNSVPLPESARATIRKAGLVSDGAGVNATVEDEFDLDMDIAGEVISGIARGLSVSESSVTGNLDPDALLSNLDWTMTINNASKYDREARAKLLLPRNAVVRGATLTINGVAHDAKIMVRGKARTRYVQSAHSSVKHRDPLLVSTCGPDEILVQCFPVKPDNSVQLKLALVCPLALDEQENAILGLPTIVEKNFREETPINIQVTSKTALQAPGILPMPRREAANSKLSLAGTVTPDALNKLNVVIHAQRNKDCHATYCQDTFAENPNIVQRLIRQERHETPQNLFVIVDASAAIKPDLEAIIEALKTLPSNMPVQLTIVGDETKTVCSLPTKASDPEFVTALDSLRKFEFIAGQDDSLALLAAVRKASSLAGSEVLWIHAAQPVYEARKEDLKNVLKYPKHHVVLNDFIISAGPQEMLEGLSANSSLIRTARYGEVEADLQNLFKTWKKPSQSEKPEFMRYPIDNTTVIAAGYLTDASLSQIYANQEILTQPETAKPTETDGAQLLARDYHLVSPISSAIVTEIPSSTEMTVATAVSPEADTWLLLIVAGALIFSGIYTQRRKPRLSST